MTAQTEQQFHTCWPEVYDRLRELAKYCLAKEPPDHTLQATALVHEVYLRLTRDPHRNRLTKGDLIGLAAHLMRQILVNHAKKKGTQKRGRGLRRVPFAEELACMETRAVDLVGLHEALDQLRTLDGRLAQVVELRFFGGLSIKSTAALLSLSESTVKNEWAVARAWLFRQVGCE
ncbi:MAG: ECF-type sigma factor [Phycisphaerales bacterium]|nr:ECF-type sigma factor [Phycisphaerales bacterium]